VAEGRLEVFVVAEHLACRFSILIVGAWLVMQPEAGMTVGMLVAFQMFASRMSQPLLRLVRLWQEFQQASISVKATDSGELLPRGLSDSTHFECRMCAWQDRWSCPIPRTP